MTRRTSVFVCAMVMEFSIFVNLAIAQYAMQVISYNQGTTPQSGYTTASAAIGEPERFTGEGVFPGVVSPFNPPFGTNEIVSVGEGGQITLRLSNYAIPQPGATPEIGVFENVGIGDANYPNGQAGTPATTFGSDIALVEVSPDGASWISLGNLLFNLPANGYTDLPDPYSATAGSAPSDFQQPFTGTLSSFNGLRYSDPTNFDMLDLLAGSGGGNWLDLSGTGLAQVGYIRFSVPDDGNPGTSKNFEVDGVSISHAAMGGPTVPEPASSLLILIAISVAFIVRRQWPLSSGLAAPEPMRARMIK
jgi:hypothetical protein